MLLFAGCCGHRLIIPTTLEAQAGESQVQDWPGLQGKTLFPASCCLFKFFYKHYKTCTIIL